jgi:hypothetical protein
MMIAVRPLGFQGSTLSYITFAEDYVTQSAARPSLLERWVSDFLISMRSNVVCKI